MLESHDCFSRGFIEADVLCFLSHRAHTHGRDFFREDVIKNIYNITNGPRGSFQFLCDQEYAILRDFFFDRENIDGINQVVWLLFHHISEYILMQTKNIIIIIKEGIMKGTVDNLTHDIFMSFC